MSEREEFQLWQTILDWTVRRHPAETNEAPPPAPPAEAEDGNVTSQSP